MVVAVALAIDILMELEFVVTVLVRGNWLGFGPEYNLRKIGDILLRSAYYLRKIGDILSGSAQPAVAAAWATLALGGRWRPERRWDERLCFLWGLYWLAYPVIYWPAAAAMTRHFP